MNYIIYNELGEILRTGLAPDFVGATLQVLNSGERVMINKGNLSITYDSHYITEEIITARPEMSVEVRDNIMKVPKNSSIYVDGEFLGNCETGVVELQFEDYSEYRVKVVKFPYKDYEIDIGVNDAY